MHYRLVGRRAVVERPVFKRTFGFPVRAALARSLRGIGFLVAGDGRNLHRGPGIDLRNRGRRRSGVGTWYLVQRNQRDLTPGRYRG